MPAERRIAERPIAAALSALALLTLAAFTERAAASTDPKVFHTVETAPLQKWDVKNPMIIGWTGMRKTWEDGQSCSAPTPTCTRAGWSNLIESLQGKDRKTQVAGVNKAFNNDALYPYKLDQNNWGKRDFYATPYQFLKKSGDCEDYAIAKYMALRQLGVPADDMRLLGVAIKSRHNEAHAVLLVAIDGQTMVLDILNKQVMKASLVADYMALISVNELDWRLHQQH